MEEEESNVVIATTNCEKALFIIGKEAMICDYMELHFMEKYAPTVEYLLRMLKKGFGWFEDERGVKEVKNTKCRFHDKGSCTNSKILREYENGRHHKCNEAIRRSCNRFERKYKGKMMVNYVAIEKAGGIRGL